MKNTEKFTGKADVYEESRPSYPHQLIEMLYTKYGFSENSIIADIGSGTGKFAKLLLEMGSKVYCVEPNADMRAAAEKELQAYNGFELINSGAENIDLGNSSCDFVTAAQAFHWFDTLRFKAECRRILRSGGKAVLIWNNRDNEQDCTKECYNVFKEFCPEFKGFSGGGRYSESIDIMFDGDYEKEELENPIYFNRRQFINRGLSASYSLTEKDGRFDEYIKALGRVFDKYEANGILEMRNFTRAYIGSVK